MLQIQDPTGTDSNKFPNIYATEFVGAVRGNVTGNVSGRAGFAQAITSPNNILQMTGEVNAALFIYDGQVGGNTKTFNYCKQQFY